MSPISDTATTDLDAYTWPTCASCSRDLTANEIGRYACRICQDRAAHDLNGIRALYPHLDTTSALIPSAATGERTRSGTRTTAPIPLNLAVLALTATGGAATRLQAIEDAWRAALGRRIGTWAGSPRQALPAHADFLVINLEWACENYAEVGDDLTELRNLHGQCKAATLSALDAGSRGPAPVAIGRCPATPADTTTPCGAPLTTTASATTVRCRTCGTAWEGVAEWITLRRAQTTLTLPVAA